MKAIKNTLSYAKRLHKGKGKTYSSIENIFTQQKFKQYQEEGYTILPKVFSKDQIDELKGEINNILSNVKPTDLKSIFETVNRKSDDYFLSSGDKKDAVDDLGNVKYPVKESLNKIGHAIHDLNEKFRRFSYSPEVKYIARMLGYISPIIVQSMYIFKNGRIGGEVTPHTDNTFIRTNPLSCFGIWVAFDDATQENGGMYGIPGSHKTKTNYFMKLAKDANGNEMIVFDPPVAPKYDTTHHVPLEAEKGTVVLLHGDFVHFSHANYSPMQRHAYTLHLVESRNHTWERDNWLQRKNVPFRFLYEN